MLFYSRNKRIVLENQRRKKNSSAMFAKNWMKWKEKQENKCEWNFKQKPKISSKNKCWNKLSK